MHHNHFLALIASIVFERYENGSIVLRLTLVEFITNPEASCSVI